MKDGDMKPKGRLLVSWNPWSKYKPLVKPDANGKPITLENLNACREYAKNNGYTGIKLTPNKLP